MLRRNKQYPTAPLHASSDSFTTRVRMFYGWQLKPDSLDKPIEQAIRAKPELLPEDSNVDAKKFKLRDGISDFELAYGMDAIFGRILNEKLNMKDVEIVVHSIHSTGEYVENPYAGIISISVVLETLIAPDKSEPPRKRQIEGLFRRWHNDKVLKVRRRFEEAFGIKLEQPTIFIGEDQVFIESY